MKKYLFSILGLVLFAASTNAQAIDSLQKLLAVMPDDTNRALAYRELWFALYDQDKQSEMLEITEKGLALSRKLQYVKGIDIFLFYKATTFDIMGKSREAIPIFEEGMLLATQQGDKKGVASYSMNIGAAYYAVGNLEKALQNYLSAYNLYKELNLQKDLSKVLNNIGIIYRTQGKHDRAEAIYKESLAIKQTLKDTLGMAASYQNLATVLSVTQREAEMINYLQKALDIYETHQRATDVAGCYSLLGQIQFNFGRFQEAKAALLKAKAQYDVKPSVEYSSNVYRLLGTLAEGEKNYAEAASYLEDGLKWAKQFGQQERAWDILNELSKVQHLLGKDAAAYASLREAFSLRDSVTEKSRVALMEEMQAKFDVAQKDSELKLNQLDLKQRTLERNWFIVGALLLGLLSVAIFFGFRSRIRANKKIAAQESALHQQQMVQLEQASKLAALNAMIEGQEKERSRIAADLHDGLGGLLTSVKSHFNALQQPSGEQELFVKTNHLIDDACGEVRRISHNMMPRALTLAGLPGALEDLAQGLEKQGIRCDLEIHGLDTPLDPIQEVTIFRIIQEMTSNVVKHARASHLLLQLIRRDGSLAIIAEDNGKGFDVQKAFSQKGLGLTSMESRVHFLQGTIEWDSVPGEGTLVSIVLPC